MSATLGVNKVRVEAYGTTATIPDDNYAKLMYYLDCVLKVIEYDGNNNKLTDFRNYSNLNNEEKKAVVQLAILFNPKLFIDANIFILAQGLFPDSSDNQFFKITDERIGVHVNQQIVIGGRTVKVLKKMGCNSSWLNRNYIIPLERITNEISNRSLQTQQNYPALNSEERVITYSKRPVVINQTTPTIIGTAEFGTSSREIICQFCRKSITTDTECEFNCGSCCLCCLTGCICFMCIQACRGKSPCCCCCDFKHKCPNCGQILGNYSSC